MRTRTTPATMNSAATTSAAPHAGMTVARPSTIAATNTRYPVPITTPPAPIAAASLTARTSFSFISTEKSSISCRNSVRNSWVNSVKSCPIDLSPFSGIAASFPPPLQVSVTPAGR